MRVLHGHVAAGALAPGRDGCVVHTAQRGPIEGGHRVPCVAGAQEHFAEQAPDARVVLGDGQDALEHGVG
ncbi:MAG: hypothetical protein WKG00_41485, partial [Polyangiaceae bacterium]